MSLYVTFVPSLLISGGIKSSGGSIPPDKMEFTGKDVFIKNRLILNNGIIHGNQSSPTLQFSPGLGIFAGDNGEMTFTSFGIVGMEFVGTQGLMLRGGGFAVDGGINYDEPDECALCLDWLTRSTGFYFPSTGAPAYISTHEIAYSFKNKEVFRIGNGVTTIKDVLNINPRSLAPSSPKQGDIYSDSDNGELCYYNGSSWDGLSSGNSGNCQ